MGVSKSGLRFGVVIAVLEIIFIVVIGILGEYPDPSLTVEGNNRYPNFQDVHVMIFLGFGCLMAFLKRYSFSAMGVSMLVAVIAVQWTAIVRGFIHHDILGGDKFPIGLEEMLLCDFSAATILVSFGVVLGKTSPVQLMVMAIFEVVLMQLNEYIGMDLLHAVDIGESMFIHAFGAYFGLAVSRVLYTEDAENSSKEGSSYQSDIISMIGTIFLWVFWPSFNGGAAGVFQERAFVNTFFSLCACTAVVFALIALLEGKGKFEMVYIQNSTLAGGVAVGASAHMPLEPFGAMVLGALAGAISVIGFKYITPFLASKLKIHDTCGVHNLHGMPGVLAGIAAAVMAAMSTDWDDGEQFAIFPVIAPDGVTEDGEDRRAVVQGGYQMLALVITLAFAIVGGAFTGFIMKLPIWGRPQGDELFDDSENWVLPEVELDHVVTNGAQYKTRDSESPM